MHCICCFLQQAKGRGRTPPEGPWPAPAVAAAAMRGGHARCKGPEGVVRVALPAVRSAPRLERSAAGGGRQSTPPEGTCSSAGIFLSAGAGRILRGGLAGSASMLLLLSSPFDAFFLSPILSLRSRFPSDALVLLKYLIGAHMSRYCHRFEAARIRDGPCPHPGRNS